MAKNRKKKPAADASSSSSSSSPSSPSSPAAAASTANTPADVAMRAGNYAAVRALANAGDDTAKKLLGLVTIDLYQVAAGLVGLAVVIMIAILTLTHP